MRKRVLGIALLVSCIVFATTGQERSAFFFGGKRLYIGMSRRDAVDVLSHCCKLSPPATGDVEERPAPGDISLGHFILPKDESSARILGAVYFSGAKIQRITRPLADDIDSRSEEVVGFARAIKRALPGDPVTVLVSVRHEHANNAESDVVSFLFPDGRGIELHVGTLDQADASGRDFTTLDETLQAPREMKPVMSK